MGISELGGDWTACGSRELDWGVRSRGSTARETKDGERKSVDSVDGQGIVGPAQRARVRSEQDQ